MRITFLDGVFLRPCARAPLRPFLRMWVMLPLLAAAGCGESASPRATAEPAGIERPWFTEITSDVGLEMIHQTGASGAYRFQELTASGGALLDFDGDGRLDVYLVSGGRDRLFRQTEEGALIDVTESAGLAADGYGNGCAVGDYDNDGDVDIYVTNYGPDQLWRNNGDGTVTDVTAEAGIDNRLWGSSAAFFDYDRDGLLDLFVVNYVLDADSAQCYDDAGRLDYCGPDSFLPSSDRLYHNEGGGRFRDASVESGIAAFQGPGLGVQCADLDDDGWDDVYVANDGARNFLWINQGDGTFRDVATAAGCAYNRDGDAEAGMGIALGDVDQDGRLDLLVTHLVRETNTLYRGAPGGGFIDATDRAGLGMSSYPMTGFGTGLVDLDHDGDLDLLVANGAVKRRSRAAPDAAATEFWLQYAEPNLLYLNDGTGGFDDVSQRSGPICTRAEVSRGLAFGDVDADGDLDVLMTQADGPARLFRNDMPKSGHWLIVAAVDPALKRDALGAVVKVTVGGRTMQRTIVASSSYASCNQPVAHFGLGPADRIDEVVIRWPDGATERFADVPIDSAVRLYRGRGTT